MKKKMKKKTIISIILTCVFLAAVLWFYVPRHVNGEESVSATGAKEQMNFSYDLVYHRRLFRPNFYSGEVLLNGDRYISWKDKFPDMEFQTAEKRTVKEYIREKVGVSLPDYCLFYLSEAKALDAVSKYIRIDSPEGYRLPYYMVIYVHEDQSEIYYGPVGEKTAEDIEMLFRRTR